jgi:hypothetical protein
MRLPLRRGFTHTEEELLFVKQLRVFMHPEEQEIYPLAPTRS